MHGFIEDIEKLTRENKHFRHVLYTGKNIQLVVMTVTSGEDVGEEIHTDRDQFFRIETGHGQVWIDGHCSDIKENSGIIVPAGARHNIVNTGPSPLHLYTLYAPPEHADNITRTTKEDAAKEPEHFDGVTTE